jgi:hypothetical protein
VIIWISGAKYSPRRQKHRKPINGKFNDIDSVYLVIKYQYINLQNIEINKKIFH